MSTESLVHSKCGREVKPEPHSEPSFVNTVSMLIHRAVPQQSSAAAKEAERILWVSFEKCDMNDPQYKSILSHIYGSEVPLIMAFGLSNGFQLWACMFNGDCVELLSIRDQPVCVVKLLPSYRSSSDDTTCDAFRESRPLLAVLPYSRSDLQVDLSLISLKSGKTVHTIRCSDSMGTIIANSRFVIVTSSTKVRIIHAGSFEELIVLTEHSLSNSQYRDCVALGSTWFAYPDSMIHRAHQSFGGVSLEVPLQSSRIATVAKTVSKTVSDMKRTVSNSVVGNRPSSRSGTAVETRFDEVGVVTIIDLAVFPHTAGGLSSFASGCQGVVAHFAAHLDEKVSCMAFNPSGTMLLTGGKSGREFHVFNVLPHPCDSSTGAVHHLYTLFRGNTNAAVQGIVFSDDSRWVAVTTVNGTSHVFAITPYGGPVSKRTHGSSKVVNRESRFERSSGVATLQQRMGAGVQKNADILCTKGVFSGSPVVKRYYPMADSPLCWDSQISRNPRLPPYSLPVAQFAVVKVKPLDFLTTQELSCSDVLWRQLYTSHNARLFYLTQAATFASARGIRVLNESQLQEGHILAFYTVGIDGKLNEFTVNVKDVAKVGPKAASAACALEVSLSPTAQWSLHRTKSNPCIEPPLEASHLIIIVNDTLQRIMSNRSNSRLGSPEVARPLVGDSSWISEIEIVTYAGPHRRLWMGPQFTFKTFLDRGDTTSAEAFSACKERSEPMTVPTRQPYSVVPVVEARSAGSIDIAPELTIEVCGSWSDNDYVTSSGNEGTLRKSIIQAMQEQVTIDDEVLSGTVSPESASPCLVHMDSSDRKSYDENATSDSSSSIGQETSSLQFSSLVDL
ncbi:breast carcinoma amplified sequence 3 [Trichuris trichiura]|uniref:Breast carcinoma amplified sequence 3 n=1 Tax=Trichuris trichiura TaxID=36087 RepID=A0A077ZE07_TRITR|nr:breast carcinoma amplified sequence 3 [Trichuris trichiura]